MPENEAKENNIKDEKEKPKEERKDGKKGK